MITSSLPVMTAMNANSKLTLAYLDRIAFL